MRKKYLSSKVEWTYIGQLIDAIDNWKIKNQVYNAVVWYVIKSSRYKIYEYILNIVNIVAPALLMIFSKYVSEDCFGGQLIIAIIGTSAAAAKSCSKLHEKRICYRGAAEAIKSETVLYINHVGIYASEERDTIFVQNIDQIRKEENINWVKLETVTKDVDENRCINSALQDEE